MSGMTDLSIIDPFYTFSQKQDPGQGITTFMTLLINRLLPLPIETARNPLKPRLNCQKLLIMSKTVITSLPVLKAGQDPEGVKGSKQAELLKGMAGLV